MKDILIRDYMLENICQAKCLLSGYPRNSIFFDSTEYLKQRKKICLSGQIITYMPTFRGTVFKKKNEKQVKTIYRYLSYIDNVLQENQTFLVKLHNFNDISIDFSYFKRVKKFPSNYSTYDVLAATDILITDYSSVFFDFANTGRKIILFTYDKKEYFEDRGVYFSFDSLPFKNVDTVEKLMDEINNKENIDYSDFFKNFGYYDKEGCTRDICQHIFKGIPSCNEEVIPYNGKKNILIYAGSMKKNGITSALLNLLSLIDTSKYNYILSYQRHEIDNHISQINIIPDNINYAPISDTPAPTLIEYIVFKIFQKNDISISDISKYSSYLPKYIKTFIIREWIRFYGYTRIHKVLQFDGYGSYVPLMFALSGKPSAIWVHNDLIQEKITRNFNNIKILNFCYKKYCKIVLVNNILMNSTLKLGASHKNIITIYNPFNNHLFIEKSKSRLILDFDTITHIQSFNNIEEKIKSYKTRFITIGRFSPEKGHLRLLHAFDEFNNIYPDSCLVIIGSHGPLLDKTVNIAKSLKSHNNIIILQSISNVAPFIKACDCFIFSSFYEGLGVVLLEATSLGIPVISTKIDAVEKFMENFGGFYVDNSKEGLLFGMKKFKNENIPPMKIDFEKFNNDSIHKFYKLVDEL